MSEDVLREYILTSHWALMHQLFLLETHPLLISDMLPLHGFHLKHPPISFSHGWKHQLPSHLKAPCFHGAVRTKGKSIFWLRGLAVYQMLPGTLEDKEVVLEKVMLLGTSITTLQWQFFLKNRLWRVIFFKIVVEKLCLNIRVIYLGRIF